MQQKTIGILSGVVIITILGAGGFMIAGRKRLAPVPPVIAIPTPSPVPLSTWKDPTGFTFQYPSDVSINPHDEDQENYAHLELTHKNHPGGIALWAKDIPSGITDSTDWVKKEIQREDGTTIDTTLGGVAAKKILRGTPTNRIVTATLIDDMVIVLEGSFEKDEYWQKTYAMVVDSLSFPNLKKADESDVSSQADSEESVDEEEVVE